MKSPALLPSHKNHLDCRYFQKRIYRQITTYLRLKCLALICCSLHCTSDKAGLVCPADFLNLLLVWIICPWQSVRRGDVEEGPTLSILTPHSSHESESQSACAGVWCGVSALRSVCSPLSSLYLYLKELAAAPPLAWLAWLLGTTARPWRVNWCNIHISHPALSLLT